MHPIAPISRTRNLPQSGAVFDGEHTLLPQTADARRLDALMAQLQHHIRTGRIEYVGPMLSQVPIRYLNAPTSLEGRTLLHEAAEHAPEPEGVIRLLLDAGANPSLLDGQGRDALMLLVRREDEPLAAATLLLRRSGEASRLDRDGASVLHVVLHSWRHGLQILVPMLLRRQADLQRPSPQGVLPLYMAAGRAGGFDLCCSMMSHLLDEQRPAVVRALSGTQDMPLGNAGTAALLHGPHDDEVVRILVLLADHGMDLSEAEAYAYKIHNSGRARRSFQDTHRCYNRARELRQLARPQPRQGLAPLPPPARAGGGQSVTPTPAQRFVAPESSQIPPQPNPSLAVSWPSQSDAPINFDIDKNVSHARSLHNAARHGPPEVLRTTIAADPEQLRIPDHFSLGGHLPIALAVLSQDDKNVLIILEALRRHHMLDAASLDTPSNNGMCALSLALRANAQRSGVLLLEAGASPLLPIPQPPPVPRRTLWGWGVRHEPSPNAAAYCVSKNRPFFLSYLLAWDERRAEEEGGRPYAFDVASLQLLARPIKKSLELRGVLEDAAHRRRAAARR